MEEKLPEQVIRRLDAGEILIESRPRGGGQNPEVVVRAVVQAPPERVWPLIDRVGDYQRVMPSVERAEEVSREQDRVRARVTLKMPLPLKNLTSVTEGVHTVEPGVRYQRRWRLVQGDYRENSGSWTLTPFAGDAARTLVEYRVVAGPRIPVPQKIQALAQKKAIPELIDNLRRLSR